MGVDETVGRWVDGNLLEDNDIRSRTMCERDEWGERGWGRDCMRKYMCSHFFFL